MQRAFFDTHDARYLDHRTRSDNFFKPVQQFESEDHSGCSLLRN
jgi:hypothetical protein